MTVLTLTAGDTFIMWLEQITERIGNGMSLIIFAGIVEAAVRWFKSGRRSAMRRWT